MNKKISLIMALAIAAILTTYTSALTYSNQAFAQQDEKGNIGSTAQTTIHFLGKILAGHEAQLGKILGGHPGLGCPPWDSC
jgi:hypothetical protein